VNFSIRKKKGEEKPLAKGKSVEGTS
jgi:hypothetical protein